MTEYRVRLIRSPDISEEERQRRLDEAYRLLFDWADRQADGRDNEQPEEAQQ